MAGERFGIFRRLKNIKFEKYEESMENQNNYDISWIIPEKSPSKPGLAMMPFAQGSNQIKYLFEYRNVGLVVNLTHTDYDFDPKAKLDEKQSGKIKFLKLNFNDGDVPSVEQVEEYIKAVEETLKSGRSVVTHCLMGLNRSGVMVACYLMKAKNWSFSETVKYIQNRRNGALSDERQYEFIRNYEKKLHDEK